MYTQIEIPDITLNEFLAFLEYLYTGHAPINQGNVIDMLALSNRYVMPRLMVLCELYISKEVERATAESIAQADIDVIGKRERVVHMQMSCTTQYELCIAE